MAAEPVSARLLAFLALTLTLFANTEAAAGQGEADEETPAEVAESTTVLEELPGILAVEGAPDLGVEGYPRLDCTLLVDPGNRAKRYLMASGQSRSIMEIELRDHATEELVAVFHGYGIGTGFGLKMFGGGARKMTQDDVQKKAKVLIKLLKEAS